MRGILKKRLLALGMSCAVAAGAMAPCTLSVRAEEAPGGSKKYTFTPPARP